MGKKLKEAKFVAHNRYVPEEMAKQYGKFATHHLRVPLLIAYDGEDKPFHGAQGTIKKLDKAFIDKMMTLTNESIVKKHSNIFAKTMSRLSGSLDDAEAIPLIKDHKEDIVDGTVGYTIGLLYTTDVHGRYELYVDALIKDIDAKIKVEHGIFQQTSFGSINDVIREISFVAREAIQNTGLRMGENTNPENVMNTNENPVLETLTAEEPTNNILCMQEQINELQMAEERIVNTLIPNTKIVYRMVKNGQVLPFKAQELIANSTPDVLMMMESSMPVHDLNFLHGIGKDPTTYDNSLTRKDLSKNLEEINKNLSKKINESTNKLDSGLNIALKAPEMIEEPQKSISDKEIVLKDILQMAEQCPEHIKDYVEFELGIKNSNEIEHNNVSLQSCVTLLQEIRGQKQNLILQMRENNE